MADSVRNFLKQSLERSFEHKQINLMLATNYRDKMMNFYMTYKNGAHEE